MGLRPMIADLQPKLMEAQLDRDALQDIRQKESQSQENVEIQLESTIKEQEAANQLQEEMLKEADHKTEHLKKMVHSHEEVLLELRGILMDCEGSTGKKVSEHEHITSLDIHNLSTAFADVLRDLDSEVSYLKEKVVLVEEELESLKKDSWTQNQFLLQQHQNRIEELLSDHEQQVAALTAKANYVQLRSVQSQVEMVQEQIRNQNPVCANQVSPLEPAISQLHSELLEAKRVYKDKVKALEKQLHLAHSETAEAQTEQDQHSQESGNLKDQIHRLLAELHKKEIELSLEREQNKRFWDQNTDNSITIGHLRREPDNKAMRLEQMESAVKDMRTECHRQMERQVAVIKEKKASLERISSLIVQLESTKEVLCKVKDDLTAKQIDLETAEEKVSHLTAHLQEEERALQVTSKETKKLHAQLGSRMQEPQRLKNEGGYLHSSECETLKLQLMEKERIIKIFQKQIDSVTQIMGQHSRTAGAIEVEESQFMKEINDWKLKAEELKIAKDEKEARIQEMEAKLSELEGEKVKLIHTCGERLQALNNMRLEKDQLMNELQASQSELSGLAAVKVAVGMQKQITANRGQIDALQSKMKFLEEAMMNAVKEKCYLREENSKLSQELSCIRAENTKIVGELEILRSRDKCLKEKIPQMETALDKASMQLAECRCIIQCQEQEAMCFRLQHALDVKELQGPGYSAPSTSGKLQHTVPLSHPHSAVLPLPLNLFSSAPHVPSKPGILKEEPLQDLKRILQELTSSGSDIPAVDPGKDGGSDGRKSPLATMRNTVNPSCLHTADLHSQDITLPFSSLGSPSIPSASSPRKVSQEERYRERSPVHLLLTAPPDDLAAGPSTSPEQGLSARKAGWLEGAPTDPHIRSQPTETNENTPRRLQNKMGSLQTLVESLQIKKQGMSSLARPQGMKKENAKEKEKLSKCRRCMN